jgi:hypothetical protein
VRQLVLDQRVELRIALGEREYDPASMRLWWGDLVAGGVGHDLFPRHRTRGGEHHQRHSSWKDEVQLPADPVVTTLRASHDAIEFRCERREEVDFEMLAFGPLPR